MFYSYSISFVVFVGFLFQSHAYILTRSIVKFPLSHFSRYSSNLNENANVNTQSPHTVKTLLLQRESFENKRQNFIKYPIAVSILSSIFRPGNSFASAVSSLLIQVSSPSSSHPFQFPGIGTELQKVSRQLFVLLNGHRLDSLILLFSTGIIIPLFNILKISPIVGFLFMGGLIGPSGFNLVQDVHLVDILGEVGIILFLYEMGLELSIERLKAMRKDVFGLGTSQFLITTMLIAFLANRVSGLPMAAAMAVGGSLALSSSAFVLQLLRDRGVEDKNHGLYSSHGRASFGILLLQDLAVVPLLVVVQLVGSGTSGSDLGKALGVAFGKASFAVLLLTWLCKQFISPMFALADRSQSHEAFLSISLATVFSMSFFTQGIGLSDTFGAFLAGILLSETPHKHRIEKSIAVFRGILLNLFFLTVGFKLDVGILMKERRIIGILLPCLLLLKTFVISILGVFVGGMSWISALRCGLLTAQAGEFAFVSLGMAQRLQILTPRATQILLSTVALSMTLTPLLSVVGEAFASKLTNNSENLTNISQ